MPETTFKSKWSKQDAERAGSLNKARECAKLTIPYVQPPAGHTEDSPLPSPENSVGGSGVVNLASKLTMALLPPNNPFFRLMVDSSILTDPSLKGKLSDVQKALVQIERAVIAELESMAVRVPILEALKHLEITGDVLLYYPPTKGRLSMYRLDSYTVQRDPAGNVLEILVKDLLDYDTLPEHAKKYVEEPQEDTETLGKPKVLELYTRAHLHDNKWIVQQEINGNLIEESKSTYPENLCPYRPLRWSFVANENYGRGIIEQIFGDLDTVQTLSRAIREGSLASSKVLFLVNPQGTTRVAQVAKTANGGFVEGRPEDIAPLRVEKYNDFQVAESTLVRLEQRIAKALLMQSSIQRSGERVTATEVSYMATELEDALGGTYSVLSIELQLWLVEMTMNRLRKKGSIPSFPKDSFKPSITTGLEALSRGHETQKMDELLAGLAQFSPEALSKFLNVGEYIKRRGMNLGIDMDGLIYDEETVNQKEQEQQMQAMMTSGTASQVVNQMGQAMQQPPQGA